MKFLKNKVVLITGGTGSFGYRASEILLKKSKLKKLVIFSRDENKQYLMAQKYNQKNVRYFIGDVRDYERVNMAMIAADKLNYLIFFSVTSSKPYAAHSCLSPRINHSNFLHTWEIIFNNFCYL